MSVRESRRWQRKLVCILKQSSYEQVLSIISRMNNHDYRNVCFPCCSPSQLIAVPFRFSGLFSLHIKTDTLLNFTCLFPFKDKSKCTLLVSFMLVCPCAHEPPRYSLQIRRMHLQGVLSRQLMCKLYRKIYYNVFQAQYSQSP